KNALAIIVDKRSGASRVIADTWARIDGRLQTFIRWHCADEIPDKAGYELRYLALQLEGSKAETNEDKVSLTRAKRSEAVSTLQRKRAGHGREEVSAPVLDELEYMLNFTNGADEELAVDQLADELIVAKVFDDAVSQAEEVGLNA